MIHIEALFERFEARIHAGLVLLGNAYKSAASTKGKGLDP